jgi:hypothetical protein
MSRFEQGGMAMTRKGRRAQLGSLLALVLGAVAIFMLPGLASAGSNSNDSTTTIKSFDSTTQTLVLSLPEGETVSGTVTRRTKIRCEDQHGHRHGGDRVRSREAEPGDDNGGHGDEPGDDNGGNRGENPADDHGDGDSSGPASSDSGPSGHDDNGAGANCSSADLVPGAAVDEVELEFGASTVRFDEVELED